ncbi:unnamed protein product [Lampetra planeri]
MASREGLSLLLPLSLSSGGSFRRQWTLFLRRERASERHREAPSRRVGLLSGACARVPVQRRRPTFRYQLPRNFSPARVQTDSWVEIGCVASDALLSDGAQSVTL